MTSQEAPAAGQYELSHLRSLEAEAIHIIREVAAEFERPVLLFSGGKDSIVMLHLALKAFRPGRLPFPVMHVDTGHNFDEVIATRDELVAETEVRLVVAKVQDDIDAGRAVETIPSRNPLQTSRCCARSGRTTSTPRSAGPDATRRRRAPRSGCSASVTSSVSGTPRPSGPSCGTSTTADTTRVSTSGSSRCPTGPSSTSGPTSAPRRSSCRRSTTPIGGKVFKRDGMLLAVDRHLQPRADEEVFETTVRFRTVGDVTCTGCVESNAATVAEVVAETAVSRLTERGATRADDRISEAGMEDRKRQGYF